MPPSFQLLGPPELHEPLNTPKASYLMVAKLNTTAKSNTTKPPMRGFTENHSPTFLSTANPCLDFFFHVVPDTPPQTLTKLLHQAWKHNDLMALKLICHLRGIRNTGKSDKEGFYTAALWLHKYHPKTLACNLESIADFGYFKDLPEILYRLLEGSDVRKIAKEEHLRRKKPRAWPIWLFNRKGKRYLNPRVKKPKLRKKQKGRKNNKHREVRLRDFFPDQMLSNIEEQEDQVRLAAEMKKVKLQVETARDLRKVKVISKARKVVQRYSSDPDFRFLHDQISQVFADHLVSDMKSLNSGEVWEISLASKWCPSLDSSFDKATLLCESIARRVFPRESYSEYEGIEDAHYAYRVRDRLRKEVLVPLRRALELPEVYISSNQWDSLPYGRVPSVAMRNYKKLFLKHDKTRFEEFLGKVERGEAKIAAGALFPHDIIRSLEDGEQDGGQVAELQWKRMVNDLSAKGKLKDCIAVCDVSGSMSGTPMEVCVALGLLLSELCEDPWKGKVFTFSKNPQLHQIEGEDLLSKTQFIRNMEWGYNTDFQKVFDIILEVAIAGNLSKHEMIKRVFVFSDMEFDEANGGNHKHHYGYSYHYYDSEDYSDYDSDDNWDTDFETIQKKFQQSGYTVPEIVFWNLRDSRATPVPSNQKGVALVSGFSKNLMTLFLDNEDIAGPEAVMAAALAGPEFKQLAVVD